MGKEFIPCLEMCTRLTKASLRLPLAIGEFVKTAKEEIRLFRVYVFLVITC